MLVDQDNGNVLAIDKLIERRLYSGCVCFPVHDEEVLL